MKIECEMRMHLWEKQDQVQREKQGWGSMKNIFTKQGWSSSSSEEKWSNYYILHMRNLLQRPVSQASIFFSEEIIIINLKTWEEMMFLEREGNKRYFDAPEEINGTLMLMLLKHRQQSILDRMFLICHFRFVFFFFGVQRMALSCNISLSNWGIGERSITCLSLTGRRHSLFNSFDWIGSLSGRDILLVGSPDESLHETLSVLHQTRHDIRISIQNERECFYSTFDSNLEVKTRVATTSLRNSWLGWESPHSSPQGRQRKLLGSVA